MNKKFLFVFFLTLLINCSNKNTKDVQTIVFNDIFTELIMSTTQDNRKATFPNPNQIKSWKQGNNISKVSPDGDKQLLIVINDSINMPRFSYKKDIDYELKYKFNYGCFSKKLDSIVIVSNSEFMNNAKQLKEKFYFGGYLNISEIYFETESLASLIVNYNCGKLCGQKSKVYLKLINNKWEITQTQVLSIS